MTTLTETCTYDALNRLETAAIAGGATASATYDALGNIQTRTGISGTYQYNAAHPHAVATAGDCTYYYDLNGNVVRRDRNAQYEFTANWNSFNKPSSLFSGTDGSEFEYGVNGKRTRQLIFEDGEVRKKIYVAETYEIEEVLSNPTETDRSLWVWTPVHSRIYIDTPAGRVGIYQKAASTDGAGTVTKSWLHKDHLGSVIGISDIDKNITYQSYDAWGNQRDADDWTAIPQSEINNHQSAMTDRGYTGHEMLSNLELVHMNGRIYDPVIGRMISPDPIIQSPGNLQSYNRYSYVMNRPLSLTDPSGFIGEVLRQNLPAFPNAVEMPNLDEAIGSFSLSEQDRIVERIGGAGSGAEMTTDYYIDGDGSLASATYFSGELGINDLSSRGSLLPLPDIVHCNAPSRGKLAATMRKGGGEATNGLGTGGGVEKPKDQNNKNGYISADNAARGALNVANPKSIKKNREYSGYIYKKDGKYHYTKAVKGSKKGADLTKSDRHVPKGADVVGDYHTHGNYSVMDPVTGKITKTGDPSNDNMGSDHFSTPQTHGPKNDIDGINKSASGKSEYTGYLGTPSGVYWRYEPSSESPPTRF